MADYIVAVDLGTSHLTGIVGERNANGIFSIIACETVETDNCIHRGMITKSDNTAKHISDILSKLERSLNGGYINKVYLGVGGQSIRTIDHPVEMDFPEETGITESDIAFLKEKCGDYQPEKKDGEALAMASAVYFVDGRKDTKPVGALCKRLEARYKLVIGRSSLRHRIMESFKKIPEKEIAGILVSPLALADAVLSLSDKELGCALVDFGAGVTSVSIYKGGDLQHLCVIPLGGRLITLDLKSLNLTDADAERLKRERGNAIYCKEDESKTFKLEVDGTEREIKLGDLNAIVEGRTREIVENVVARICDVIEPKELGAGIVLAGCASELENLPELIKEKCKVKHVRFSIIQKGLVNESDEIGNPLYMMAISLMLKGTESCVSNPLSPWQPNEKQEKGHLGDTGQEGGADDAHETDDGKETGDDKAGIGEKQPRQKNNRLKKIFKDYYPDLFT